MILYDAAHAPSARRVRIAIAELGLEVERRTIDLRAGEHLREAYRRINPYGTVPALLVGDVVLTDSVAICRYLDGIAPEPLLFGSTPIQIGLVEQWCRRIDEHGYRSAVDKLRNRASAFADRAIPGLTLAVPQVDALINRSEIVFSAFIQDLNVQLRTNEWIAGALFSFADIAALVAIDFAERVGLSIEGLASNVIRWRCEMNLRHSASA